MRELNPDRWLLVGLASCALSAGITLAAILTVVRFFLERVG